MQGAAEDPGACRLHLLLEDADPLHELPHLLLGHRVAGLTLDAVDGQQVLRHADPPSGGRALPASYPHYERASARLTGRVIWEAATRVHARGETDLALQGMSDLDVVGQRCVPSR